MYDRSPKIELQKQARQKTTVTELQSYRSRAKQVEYVASMQGELLKASGEVTVEWLQEGPETGDSKSDHTH